MPTSIHRGRTAVLLASGALLLALLAPAPQAQAVTIYACVKKDGTARFVTRTRKCRKGETKLSWNSQGPAGSNGAAGAPGAAGAEGKAGAQGPGAQGITASQVGSVAMTPIATFAAWTLAMECEAGGVARLKLTGPGSFAYSLTRGTPGVEEKELTEKEHGAIGAGFERGIGFNFQMTLQGFLVNGSMIEALNLEMWDAGGNCGLVGDAIPLS